MAFVHYERRMTAHVGRQLVASLATSDPDVAQDFIDHARRTYGPAVTVCMSGVVLARPAPSPFGTATSTTAPAASRAGANALCGPPSASATTDNRKDTTYD